MGMDLSQLDAELSALGELPTQLADLVRRYGVAGPLAEIDAQLAQLGQDVALAPVATPKPQPARPAAAPAKRAAPAKPALPAAPDVAPVQPVPAPAREAAPLVLADPVEPAPASVEIELPDPVQAPPSAETTRSGSFALDVGFEDEGDADFEAEFAALAAPLKAPAPPESKAAERPAASVQAAPLALEPEPSGDGPLALFHLGGDAAVTDSPVPAAGRVEHRPSSRPAASREAAPPSDGSAALRDPDAEFDALFADASSPSSVPATSTDEADEDSVDDLLRDLSSPRLPLDLAAEANLADSLESELEGSETAGSAEAKARDSDNPFPTEEELASSEFEIVMDDEDDGAAKTGKPPAGKGRPPQPPPAPEKRPSFLGRLFGPKKE